jgi:hypothetical protein
MLNSLYTTWDELCEERGALGVDFSGSTYVAVSGHDDNARHLETILKVFWGGVPVCRGVAPLSLSLSLPRSSSRLGLNHPGGLCTANEGVVSTRLTAHLPMFPFDIWEGF